MLQEKVGESANELVQRIPPPASTPATTADRLTAIEESTLKGQRHSIYLSRVHMDQLEEDKEYFRLLSEHLQKRVDELLPRVAELEQASKGVTLACVYYTGMMVVGGGLISGAGYVEATAKFWFLVLGWFLLLAGIIAHWVSSVWGWPKKKT